MGRWPLRLGLSPSPRATTRPTAFRSAVTKSCCWTVKQSPVLGILLPPPAPLQPPKPSSVSSCVHLCPCRQVCLGPSSGFSLCSEQSPHLPQALVLPPSVLSGKSGPRPHPTGSSWRPAVQPSRGIWKGLSEEGTYKLSPEGAKGASEGGSRAFVPGIENVL